LLLAVAFFGHRAAVRGSQAARRHFILCACAFWLAYLAGGLAADSPAWFFGLWGAISVLLFAWVGWDFRRRQGSLRQPPPS
jgi:hypothetical protein